MKHSDGMVLRCAAKCIRERLGQETFKSSVVYAFHQIPAALRAAFWTAVLVGMTVSLTL